MHAGTVLPADMSRAADCTTCNAVADKRVPDWECQLSREQLCCKDMQPMAKCARWGLESSQSGRAAHPVSSRSLATSWDSVMALGTVHSRVSPPCMRRCSSSGWQLRQETLLGSGNWQAPAARLDHGQFVQDSSRPSSPLLRAC